MLPQKKTEGSAAYDIHSCLDKPKTIDPMQRLAIPTGLIFEIPSGYFVSIRPRSGLAIHHGITLVNSPGTIDSDFRGEIKILLINLSNASFVVDHGDRIAQMIIEKTVEIRIEEAFVSLLSKTKRGVKGFGSTGY